jgi:lipid-binding SYLF domain-containing protein
LFFKQLITLFAGIVISLNISAGWNPDDKDSAGGDYDDPAISEAVSAFINQDPGISKFFENAYGFAVFPSIGKGGLGIGGAAGKGKVYAQGEYLGLVKLKQFTIGFQFGGQKYREIIFFKNEDALEKFTSGKFKFGAQASAVAATAGASADAAYSDQVAVFTLTIKGLMYEATVGGQKFKFKGK